MKRNRRYITTLLVTAAATGNSLGASGEALAGCPCRGGGTGLVDAVPLYSPTAVTPYPVHERSPPANFAAGTDAALTETIQPPSGTVGRTYQIKSRPIPVTMHPRVGMVDVCVAGSSEVLVHDMNPNRTEDRLEGFQDAANPNMWHFQSEPMLPGLPHIYRIEARRAGPDGAQMEERYVRLIMGRLIEVTF